MAHPHWIYPQPDFYEEKSKKLLEKIIRLCYKHT